MNARAEIQERVERYRRLLQRSNLRPQLRQELKIGLAELEWVQTQLADEAASHPQSGATPPNCNS